MFYPLLLHQIKLIQFRENAQSVDMSSILSEDLEENLKQASITSMGTEISQDDMNNITDLCTQLIELSEYRTQLFEYLSNRCPVMQSVRTHR